MPPVPQWGVDPNRGKRMALYGVLTGIGIVLAAIIGLNAAGLLQLRAAPTSKGLLQATGERPNAGMLEVQGEKPPSGTLQVQSEQPPPVLEQTAPENTPMPADVRDWLEHLRRTEEKRNKLATDQVAQAVVLLTELQGAGASMDQLQGLLGGDSDDSDQKPPKTPADTAMETTKAMQAEWVKLTDFFNSKKPPEECVPLRDDYDQVLRETGGMMMDIIEAATGAAENPSAAIAKLQGMKGKSKNLIDKPAQETDQGVAAICKKYNTPKWFEIQADTGGGFMEKLGL